MLMVVVVVMVPVTEDLGVWGSWETLERLTPPEQPLVLESSLMEKKKKTTNPKALFEHVLGPTEQTFQRVRPNY